jgi:endonuclease/exonuclease/phosphatase family metal-dependent hydrolase
MLSRLLTRRRVVQGQQVREPTPLAVVLTAAGLLALLGVCGMALFATYPLGHDGLVALAAGALLVWLLFRARPGRAREALPSTRGRRWQRGVLRLGRGLFVVVLAGWLGLIGWARLSPGGPAAPPKEDPAAVRVLTWNIHCGQEGGPLWKRFDWAGRKGGVRTAVRQAAPDILCVQEAVAEQVAFLERTLPDHIRVGVGREDGASGGEFCALFFRRDRFELLGSGTFWLDEPTDRPGGGPLLRPRRICTWARLRDRATGRTVRVYNTHLPTPLEGGGQEAARVILGRIAAGERGDAIILTGDFNTTPGAPTWRLFTDSGLADSAELAGQAVNAPTYHFYGVRVRRLDGILVGPSWQVRRHRILDVKPGTTFPSDHFGVLADLTPRG